MQLSCIILYRSMNNFKMLLRGVDLKTTNARLAVLKYMTNTSLPLDADSIHENIESKHVGRVDRVTVYRILDNFYKKGLVNRLQFQEGKFRYELSDRREHHHLICEKCGSIEDVPDCNIKELEKEIQTKKQFLVKRHSLEFFGLCPVCQR